MKVVFHNLAGYDSHLFLKNVAKNGEKLDAIMKNAQEIITFNKNIIVETKIKKDKNGIEQKKTLL